MFTPDDEVLCTSCNSILDGDAQKQLNGKGNTLQFIAGHIVSGRYYIRQLAGMEVVDSNSDIFMSGYDPSAELPPLKELKKDFKTISQKLIAHL